MKTLRYWRGFFLVIVCCFGFTSNVYAANCFCKFWANGVQIGANATTGGGYLQTSCGLQKACHDYCNGYLAAGTLDAAAEAHRCGAVTIYMQSAVGTEGYCDDGLNTRTVTGTGIYTAAVAPGCPPNYAFPGPVGPLCVNDVPWTAGACASGSWLENTYGASTQPHPVCVKQACPQGCMPGVPQWHVISGTPSTGGAYLTDNNGGTRFFVDAKLNCPSGYTLTTAGYKPGLVCRKSVAAIPGTPASCR